MATGFEGLFSDPNEIRSARLDALAKQQAQNKNLSLLNQVAAGRGAQIAEGLSGMFGLKTPEEAKAIKLQEMSKNFDTQTPEGLTAFAKALNDSGMTKEAVIVLKQRDAVVDRTRRMAAEDAITASKLTKSDRFKVVGNRIFDITLNNGEGGFVEGAGIPQNVDGQVVETVIDGKTVMQVIDRNTGKPIGKPYPVPAKGITLSATEAKAGLDAQGAAMKANAQIESLDNIINVLDNNPFKGGELAKADEKVKAFTGNRNIISYAKTEVARLKNLEAMGMLPPGAASDADVALALQGVPPEGASSEEYSRWFKALRSAQAKIAKYNDFKSTYILDNGAKGFASAWKEQQAPKEEKTTTTKSYVWGGGVVK